MPPLESLTPIYIVCMCGKQLQRSDLIREKDIEQYHPKNKNNPRCTPIDSSGCHMTFFEKCPKCERCLFADSQPTGLGEIL